MLDNQIVIVDYKMGNLRSVQKAFEKIGASAIISNDIETIKSSQKIVLPGVGSFKDGMKHLKELNLIELLNEEVIVNRKPFLGICLGMQLISNKSYENVETNGLGWIDAEVIKFEFLNNKKLKVPHVGWNNVSYKEKNLLYNGIENNSDFYFVHSYHFDSKEEASISSTTDYGFDFISSVQKDNIYAFQFHPEKSQTVGLKLLENFVNL